MFDQANPLNSYISHALASAHREVQVSLSRRLKIFDVQIEAWRIMETLDDMPAVTMTELAGLVLMNPPTLTKLVDRMVSDGLVHRQVAVKDRRQVNLILTDLGLRRLVQVRDAVKSEDGRILEIVGEENAGYLNQLLEKLSHEYSEN